MPTEDRLAEAVGTLAVTSNTTRTATGKTRRIGRRRRREEVDGMGVTLDRETATVQIPDEFQFLHET
jgi:hypothetical protein